MTKKVVTKKEKSFDFRTIRTPEDAFRKQGMDPAIMPDISKLPERFGFLTTVFILSVIIEAANDGWKPDFSDTNQPKYYVWPLVSSSGLDFLDSFFFFDFTYSFVCFPLYFKSPEIAQYILKQFEDLWKHWLLNFKPQ